MAISRVAIKRQIKLTISRIRPRVVVIKVNSYWDKILFREEVNMRQSLSHITPKHQCMLSTTV